MIVVLLILFLGLLVVAPALVMALGAAPLWAWLAVYVAELAGLLIGQRLARS